MKKKVFVSWSGPQGAAFGRCVRAGLEQYLPCEVFFSPDMPPGTDWLDRIRDEAQAATCAIIILTRESKLSPWVMIEAGFFVLAPRRVNVIPLLLDLTLADLPDQFKHLNTLELAWLDSDADTDLQRTKLELLYEAVAAFVQEKPPTGAHDASKAAFAAAVAAEMSAGRAGLALLHGRTEPPPPDRIVATQQGISKMQEKVLHERHLFASLTSAMPLYVLDAEFRILFMNFAAQRVFDVEHWAGDSLLTFRRREDLDLPSLSAFIGLVKDRILNFNEVEANYSSYFSDPLSSPNYHTEPVLISYQGRELRLTKHAYAIFGDAPKFKKIYWLVAFIPDDHETTEMILAAGRRELEKRLEARGRSVTQALIDPFVKSGIQYRVAASEREKVECRDLSYRVLPQPRHKCTDLKLIRRVYDDVTPHVYLIAEEEGSKRMLGTFRVWEGYRVSDHENLYDVPTELLENNAIGADLGGYLEVVEGDPRRRQLFCGLMRTAISYAQRRHIKYFYAQVPLEMEQSYTGLGFRPVGPQFVAQGFGGQWIPVLLDIPAVTSGYSSSDFSKAWKAERKVSFKAAFWRNLLERQAEASAVTIDLL